MGGVQTFLALGALFLFSLLVLNVNRIILSTQDLELKNEAQTTASSVAETMLNEVVSKSFDKSTLTNAVFDSSLATAPNMLGPESGEVYPNFNDVDDFNNYTRNDTTPRLGVFSLKVKVSYIDNSNALVAANSVQRTKLIEIAVFNTVLVDTFKLYRYRSY